MDEFGGQQKLESSLASLGDLLRQKTVTNPPQPDQFFFSRVNSCWSALHIAHGMFQHSFLPTIGRAQWCRRLQVLSQSRLYERSLDQCHDFLGAPQPLEEEGHW